MSNIQRVAVITGASQGIGEGLVAGFRKLGYAVVANSRSIAESDDPMVLAVPGDIGQPGVGQRIVDAALDGFGRIDTVVNNAGIFIPKSFTDYTDDDYDAITGVNLRGFFEVSRAAIAAPSMPTQSVSVCANGPAPGRPVPKALRATISLKGSSITPPIARLASRFSRRTAVSRTTCPETS